MKYTNILINGNYMDFEKIVPQKIILKEATIVVCLPIVTVSLVLVGSCIPCAMFIDGVRYIKYKQLKSKRLENINLN
jgi:hypothetical protein